MTGKGADLARSLIGRLRVRSGVSRLLRSDSDMLRKVGEAILATMTDRLSAEERAVIAPIELRRAAMLSSDRTIPVIDYGAGSPDSRRSRDEMEKGVESEQRIADICRASKPAFWATLMFELVRKLEPESSIELGTCVGVSAAYQAAALGLNGRGRLVTLEGSPEIAAIARETFATLGQERVSVMTGPFHRTLSPALEAARPVDFFFNDGHHDHDAVIQYFEQSLPFLADPAVIVFDDISWSPGMRAAWSEIESDGRVSATVDLRSMGIALVGGCQLQSRRFLVPV